MSRCFERPPPEATNTPWMVGRSICSNRAPPPKRQIGRPEPPTDTLRCIAPAGIICRACDLPLGQMRSAIPLKWIAEEVSRQFTFDALNGRCASSPDVTIRAGQPREDYLPRRPRRLSGTIFVAFHSACDQGELEVAGSLVQVLEHVIKRPMAAGMRQRYGEIEALVASYERLWYLRHRNELD
jgi:hypothetical protein